MAGGRDPPRRPARAGDVGGRIDRRGAGGRDHPRHDPYRAVAGSDPGQDLGHARHAAPVARPRVRPVYRRAAEQGQLPQRSLAEIPRPPVPGRYRRHHRRRADGARRALPDAGATGRRGRRARGTAAQCARGHAVRLGVAAETGGLPGLPLLRPQPGPGRHLRPPRPVAGHTVAGNGPHRGAARDHPALPGDLRPGHARRFRPLVGRARRGDPRHLRGADPRTGAGRSGRGQSLGAARHRRADRRNGRSAHGAPAATVRPLRLRRPEPSSPVLRRAAQRPHLPHRRLDLGDGDRRGAHRRRLGVRERQGRADHPGHPVHPANRRDPGRIEAEAARLGDFFGLPVAAVTITTLEEAA